MGNDIPPICATKKLSTSKTATDRSVRLAERWNMADEHGEFDWAEREGNMHHRSAASPYIRN